MSGNAMTLALRLTGMVAVACCIAVPAIGSGFSPTASMRHAQDALTLRLDTALAPTVSEPAAPWSAAVKSERPRVGLPSANTDTLDPAFDIATDAGARLQDAPGRLLASVDLPTTQASVVISVESARKIESVSLDAVLVVDSIDADGAQIELKAPFKWSLASAFEQDLVPGREHHLQIVASAKGVDTRLNGKLVAEFESDEVSDLAAALVALELRGIAGTVKDLSVTRERVLDDGRMRATLLSSRTGELSAIEHQLAAIDEDLDKTSSQDGTQTADTESATADEETPGESVADQAQTPDATDAEAVLEPEIADDANIAERDRDDDENVEKTAENSELLDTDSSLVERSDDANSEDLDDGLTLQETEVPAAQDDKGEEAETERPSLGLFELAGLDDDALAVKPEEVLAAASNDADSTAESGPEPLIDGVQEPGDAPLAPPDLNASDIADSGSDATELNLDFNADPNAGSDADPNADTGLPSDTINPDDSILTDSETYAANGADDRGLYQDSDRDYAEEPLPNFYEPEAVEPAYIEPVTNQDPLLAAIQRQQEEALLLQQSAGQTIDESHAPSEPLLEETVSDENDDALDVDEDAELVDQGSTTETQPGYTEQNPIEDSTGSDDSTDTASTGTTTTQFPTTPAIPGTGLPTTTNTFQPPVRSFFSFDPATSSDVIAWFRLDGSLSDQRGVLNPLSNRGTSFDTDSFTTQSEPGNQRVRVEGSGEQLRGSVDVQLLNFVGVTQRISISAMIFVNEWDSSFLSSPTILQFGNNTGPGIELVDTNAGRQILGAGDVIFDSGTVDAVLTREAWHHLRVDLTTQGYELRVNGSLIGQSPAPDDLAKWDEISAATIRAGNFDGFVDEIVIVSTNLPATTSTGSTTDPADPGTTTGTGGDGSDPTAGATDDDTVTLVSYPLSDNFSDATTNGPEMEVIGNAQFVLTPPTITTGAVAATSFGQEGDQVYAPLPFDNLITDPLERLVFEAQFRLNDWDATRNVPVMQLRAEGRAWFSFAWDPAIGPDMAVAELPLAAGETLQRIFEDQDWHNIVFVMTQDDCSVSIDGQTVATVACPGAIEGWPAPDTELVLGNFSGFIRSVEIRAAEDN